MGMNASRRARRNARRKELGLTHEHIKGTSCTVCRPVPGSELAAGGVIYDELAQVNKMFRAVNPWTRLMRLPHVKLPTPAEIDTNVHGGRKGGKRKIQEQIVKLEGERAVIAGAGAGGSAGPEQGGPADGRGKGDRPGGKVVASGGRTARGTARAPRTRGGSANANRGGASGGSSGSG